jgi:predicted RND superfamily exporter protein
VRVFDKLNQFFSRHSFKVILVAIFLLPVCGRGARKALQSNDNDVHDWLPATYQETADFSWFQKHFENETFVLISWEGCTLDDPRLELLAKKLVPAEKPEEQQHFGPLPKPEDDSRWYDDLFFSSWVSRPKKKTVVTGPLFQHVDTGQRLLDRLMSPPISLPENEALKRLEKLFIGADHEKDKNTGDKQTCAVVTLTEAGKQDLRATLAKLQEVCREELGLSPERIKMGGPPVDNVAISVEGEKTLLRLFIPAGIVGLALAFWCLRSVRLTIMVFATALYAGAISLSIVHYSGAAMNAILLTMPAVVYVAGISGAIHFANYYRDAVAEAGIDGAPARALLHSWLPCVLSAGTTSAGLFSLYTSELVPIQMFGVYSALGVLSTLLLLFIFLPSWMQLWPMQGNSLLDGEQPKAEDIDLPVRWRKILQGVLDNHRKVLVGLTCVMLVCGLGLAQINTSIKLMNLFSPSAQIIHDYRWLETNLGPLVPMEVIVKIDQNNGLNMLERMELIGRVQKEMQTIQHIGSTMSAATFAPEIPKGRRGLVSANTTRDVTNRRLEANREEYLQSDFLAVEDGTDLWRISCRVGALNDVDYGEFKNEIQRRVEPVLKAERERIIENARANAQRAAQRAEREAQRGDDPAALAKAREHAEKAAAELAALTAPDADETLGISAVYTGLVPVVYKAQREMLNGLAWNFVTDLLTISAVMMIVFADLSAGLILLVPSIFPIMIVFGMMGWLGVVIDVGTIMTPTVALGVSVDDVVHFLIWYRRGLREGRIRKGAVMLAYEGCARAMYQSWSVLGLGLAVFALSSFVPTQRFGAMMFLLLTAALVGNLFMLPTVLCSPISYLFGRRLIKQAKAARLGDYLPLEELPAPEPLAHVRHDTSHRMRTSN